MAFDLGAILNPGKRPLMGLDISSSAVKMVELQEAGKRFRIERYAVELLQRNAVDNGNIVDLDSVSESVRRCRKRLGGSTKYAALALPTASVITKKITLSASLREIEMEQLVESEANQYIPFQIDEVNLDFQVLGPANNSEEEVEVLLAAARKDLVEDRVACVEAAGMRALIMDSEANAIQSAFSLITAQFPNNGDGQLFAYVDVGTNTTNLIIFSEGEPIYTREQSFGGQTLTQAIINQYGMTPEEAETAKRTGDLPENYESEVADPYLENLSDEVSRALQFFFTSTQYTSVDHLVLAGGGSNIGGAREAIESRTDIKTIHANPFHDMQLASKLKGDKLAHDGVSLMVACGLAMRRFDKK